MEEKGAALSLRPSDTSTAVVFDRHPLWLRAIGSILVEIGVRVAGSTTSGDELLQLVETAKPDLLVAEPSPGRTGSSEVAILRRARKLSARLRIVAVSASDDPEDIAAAFDAGAMAYVLKTAEPADIATAVRQAFGSTIFLPGTSLAGGSSTPDTVVASVTSADISGLTRRELEILKLVAEGYTNSQLARMLWVTEQTIKFHLSNIYRKLDVANRTEASRWAQRHGLLARSGEPTASA